jgi:hypothetical protein
MTDRIGSTTTKQQARCQRRQLWKVNIPVCPVRYDSNKLNVSGHSMYHDLQFIYTLHEIYDRDAYIG